MVVLEGGGMLSANGNQYLQPDYLTPLPTTLDAKKSPLALLAQTCSQIGADTSSTAKSLLSTSSDKSSNSKKSSDNRSPPAAHTSNSGKSSTTPNSNDKLRTSPSAASIHHQTSTAATITSVNEIKPLAFKPYETNVLTRKSDQESSRPPSSSSKTTEHDGDKRTPSRKSSSDDGLRSSPDRKTPGSSPVIRSGLEVLQGHKDSLYKPLSGLCCPPGLDVNPAFRPPFLGPYPTAPNPQPYLSYARVKTASGGEALVPVCKDPYCTGCQYSQHNPLLANTGQPNACPAGCAQCEHQKQYGLAVAMSLQNAAVAASYAQLTKPYVCNWVAGDATTYCGKRFGNSEELLQHLRTHTGGAASASDVANAASYASALHRAGYPAPGPLSPLSAAARYHPYAKPPGLLPGTPLASPYGAFGPALGAYYNPYALYAGAQRLGAAAHQ